MSRIGLWFLVVLALVSVSCGYGSNYMGGGNGGPNITSLNPNVANAGGEAFTLTVVGTGFGTDAVVVFNGAAQSSAYVTGSQVTAQISATEIMNAGMMPVYVRSGGKNSNTIDFTVQP